jgi:hypothetical protein
MRPVLLGTLLLALLVVTDQQSLAQLRVTGGNILMQVTTTVPTPDPIIAVNTATNLRWRREDQATKITVSTVCPGQRFGLRVLATALSAGVAAPEVTLVNGMPAVDLIVNIPAGGPNNKSCTLRYTAIATCAQGNSTEVGNDVHTITYTHVAQ